MLTPLMEAFLVSILVVAIGEIGDKTQLLALMLAAQRYLRDSGRIKVFARRGKAFAEVWAYDGTCSDKIHRAAKQSLQAFLEGKVGVGVYYRRYRVELDKEIQIARRRIEVVTHGGAKRVQPSHVQSMAKLGQLGTSHFDQWLHVITPYQLYGPCHNVLMRNGTR